MPGSEAHPAPGESDDDHQFHSAPAIEELRKKISGNGYKPAFRRIVNDGTPTFATFKFGYLPVRGLLYSVIGHELALFGLFLMLHYGLPALRAQKLITTANMQDHNIVYLRNGRG